MIALEATSKSESIVDMVAASTAATRSERTVVFLTSDAIRLATPGYADDIQAEGYEPLKVFFDKFRSVGGRLGVRPACAKARGMSDADLIDGASIDGVPAIMDFLDEDGITLM